ncbi:MULTISPECIES: histidine phosphatase family protein [unclassified Paenibacillus]|uniref:histidine phosphatase family protein n=1 Tax=unclassified Paenibacillus TaxID=185978 RepID=UPI0030F9C899
MLAPKLDQVLPKVLPKVLKLQLVLLRHGHTQWNKERRYLGSTDIPLLPGAQEELTALREQPELRGDFWRVYCSDLRRCRETLACIAPGLEASALYDSRLREMSFGAWEGCTYEQLQNNLDYRSWIDDPAEVTPPDGESWQAFEARLDSFLKELRQAAEANGDEAELSPLPEDSTVQTAAPDHHPSKEPLHLRVLLVTHGGVIRQLLARALEDVTFRTAAAPPPGTAVVLTLVRSAGKWQW